MEFANIAQKYEQIHIYFQTQIPPINERLPCLSWTVDRHELATSFLSQLVSSLLIVPHCSHFSNTGRSISWRNSKRHTTEIIAIIILSNRFILNYPQISSIIINYRQISSIIINHHQLSSININHHQLSLIRQSNSDGESRHRSLQIIFKIINISIFYPKKIYHHTHL